jgi:hypothetical protein
MTFTLGLSRLFAAELQRLPSEQQDAVDDFIELYEKFGLADQTKFPGRISPSWHTLPPNHTDYQYAQKHSLWHYHCGLPQYTGGQAWGKTSDYLIHLRWVNHGAHIDIVDVYHHYRYGGAFYIPTADRLAAHEPETPNLIPPHELPAQEDGKLP